MTNLVLTNPMTDFIENRVISDPQLKLQQSHNGRRLLYVAGTIVGFVTQIPFVRIASQASKDPVFSKVLGGAYFISWGLLFSWLYGKIIQGESNQFTPNDAVPCSMKKSCLKTVKISSAFILAMASLAPDSWFSYQFNGAIVFPLITLFGGAAIPAYSLLQSMNRISRCKLLSDEEKELKKSKQSLVNQIEDASLNLNDNATGFLDLKESLLSSRNDGNQVIESGLSIEARIQDRVIQLFDNIKKYTLANQVSIIRKRIGLAFGGLGLPLGAAQLALSYVGTKALMENITTSPGWTHGGAIFSTLIVTYLYGFDIPMASKGVFERVYDVLTEGRLKTIGAKISPVANGALTVVGTLFAAFSWGSLLTLSRTYFKEEDVGLFWSQTMDIALPAGFVLLILRALNDIIDDGLREFNKYFPNRKNSEAIAIYQKLETLKEYLRGISISEYAAFIQQVPSTANGLFGKSVQSLRTIASGVVDEEATLGQDV